MIQNFFSFIINVKIEDVNWLRKKIRIEIIIKFLTNIEVGSMCIVTSHRRVYV